MHLHRRSIHSNLIYHQLQFSPSCVWLDEVAVGGDWIRGGSNVGDLSMKCPTEVGNSQDFPWETNMDVGNLWFRDVGNYLWENDLLFFCGFSYVDIGGSPQKNPFRYGGHQPWGTGLLLSVSHHDAVNKIGFFTGHLSTSLGSMTNCGHMCNRDMCLCTRI